MSSEKTQRLVKVKYVSCTSDFTVTKKLFGYKGWQTKSGVKTYSHKPIVGTLQGIPYRKVGRATIVLPEDYLSEVRDAIERAGGIVRSVSPVAADWEDNSKDVLDLFRVYLSRLISLIHYAEKAPTRELYELTFDKSISLTRAFESYIAKFDEYGSLQTDRQLLNTLVGLKSISGQDMEAARLQTAFFANELGRELRIYSRRRAFPKSSNWHYRELGDSHRQVESVVE